MPLNPDAVGMRSGPTRRSWTSADCLLYALGVGAGSDSPAVELQFTTENSHGVAQRALPTTAVVLSAGSHPDLGDIDPAAVVHGDQSLILHRELPVEGELESAFEVVAVYDKGTGAVVEIRNDAVLLSGDAPGEPLFSARMSLFIRGEGGWGGERGPARADHRPPDRRPDAEVRYPTRPEQALLYRLSGDRNPLHSDPIFARRAGFEGPILHGLCTFGFTGRALLHSVAGGDPALIRSLYGRFSSPVIPGETLTVRIWRLDEHQVVFRTLAGDRVVLDHGVCNVGAVPAPVAVGALVTGSTGAL